MNKMYTVYDANGHVLAEKVDAHSAVAALIGYDFLTHRGIDGMWHLHFANDYGGYSKLSCVSGQSTQKKLLEAFLEIGKYAKLFCIKVES
jgi:hypothetical protein